MSSSFEDLKSQWRPGEVDDTPLEETLLRRQELRREQEHQEREQEVEQREETFEREHSTEERAQHGGESTSGTGAGGPSEGAGAEPLPQRDDPDDGEHASSQIEDDKLAAEDVEPEPALEEEPEEISEPESDPIEEPDASESEVSGAGESQRARPVRKAASAPQPSGFTRGVAFSHSSEEVVLKRFPKELADRLRQLAAVSLGESFAGELSLTQLVAAFVASRLGEPFETDGNTEQVVAAFREDDPRLSVVEDRTGDLLSDMDALRRDVARMRETLGEVSLTGESVQMGVSYLLVDRTLGVNTDGLTPGSIDVDQPRVLEATDNIRRRTKQQRSARMVREGRRLS